MKMKTISKRSCLPFSILHPPRHCPPVLVLVLVLVLFLPACSEKPSGPDSTPAHSPDKVIIKGSNTVGEELAPRLIAEFKKDRAKATFDLESKGTGSGFSALTAGSCDIAAASRDMIPGELELARSHGLDFKDYHIGAYSVAVVVHSSNPVSNLTTNQVRGLFTGTIKNWKEVGGPDAPVHLYIRNPVSGTYLGFQELAMENKPYAPDVKLFTNYTEIVQAVAQDPGGVGYAGFQIGNKSGTKEVPIGGVAPTAATINASKYPFARFLHLYTSNTRETPLTHDFVQFVLSKPGQQILEQLGFVPHP